LNQVATICSDSASGVSLNLSSSVNASTYNITAINQNGLTASAGVPVIGNNLAVNVIADDAWTNTTPLPVDVVYTIVPVSANNCQGNPFTVTLTINPEPVVANQTGTICSDVANGVTLGNDIDTPQAATYNITNINPNGLPIYAGNPTTGTGLAANVIADDAWTNTTPAAVDVVYTVVPVSSVNCQGNPFTVTITVESELVISNQSSVVCSDTANGLILGSEPTATYTITNIVSNGLISSAGNPQVGSGFLANEIADDAWTNDTTLPVTVIYTITPQTSSGCTGNPVDITLTINPEPIVVNQSQLVCSDESSNLILGDDIDGPNASTYNIVAINTNGLTPFAGNPQVGSGLLANEIADDAWTNATLATVPVIYTIVPVSAQGCLGNPFTVTMNINPQINVQITTTPITCYGANNATITLTVTGGSPSYTAQWDNLATGFYQDNLAAGTYVILITDDVMCTKTVTVVIPEALLFTVNPIVKNVSCFGANDGSINLNFVGGIPAINLTWSDGSNAGTTRNNLGPGTYSVTIIDGTPCTILRTFTIVEPLPLVLSANVTNAFDCTNGSSGAIDLTVSGGNLGYTYSWTPNGATTQDLINITAGNYAVTVIDSKGCTKSAQYSITRPAPIEITVTTQTTHDCDAHTVVQSFVAQATGGIPGYSYQWSNGQTGPVLNTTINGTYQLTVTDSYGCSETETVIVDIPVLGYSSFDTTSYGYTTYGLYSVGDPIQFQSTITGDYISVFWDFGDGTFSSELNPIHTYLIPRDYIVTQTVTYPFGCVYVQTISLIVEKGYLLVVPTAFTPNSDNLNDTYRPVTKALKNIKLDIYDTWGSLIYSETCDEILVGWDGKVKGFNAENGNYYSKVSAETFYGTIVYSNQTFVLIK
jgi:large repetitive protein